MQFNETTIWLIGASEGIGRALAIAMAEKGAHVAVSARNEERLKSLVSELKGLNHLSVPVDVTSDASLESAFQSILKQWKRLDMVIYNAGIYIPSNGASFDFADAATTVDTNLLGVFRMLSKIVPFFKTRSQGRIAFVASVAGYRGLPGSYAYGASKAALNNLAETLKLDLWDSKIHVHVINPGFVKTRLTDKNSFPMPCMISPEKAASAIISGLEKEHFAIDFPKRFTLLLKALRILPLHLYFRLIKSVKL